MALTVHGQCRLHFDETVLTEVEEVRLVVVAGSALGYPMVRDAWIYLSKELQDFELQ